MRTVSHKLIRATAICCLAGLLGLSAAVATAGTPAPTLTVSAGSATASGGKLKGSVTVHNAGTGGSGHYYLTLVVKLTGSDRLLRRAGQHAL